MKKIKYLLMIAVVAVITMAQDCNNDPDDPDKPKAPIINLKSPSSAAFEVAKGDVVTFDIEALASANTNKDISKLYFKVTYVSTSTSWDTTWYPDASELKKFPVTYDYNVPATMNPDDVINVLIQVTDIDNQTGSKNVSMTVKDLSGLKTYLDVELGAHYNESIGQFFATSTKLIYNIADAETTGQTKIDFVHFYAGTNAATIASPDDTIFGTGSGQIENLQVHKWTTRNSTRFRLMGFASKEERENFWETLTVTKASQAYAVAGTPINTRANQLFDESGGGIPSYIVFKTGQGKYGVFRVKEIKDYSSYGSIVIDVKVAK